MLRCLVICLFCSSFAFVETAKRAASASPFAPFFFTTNNPSNSPCPLLFTLFSGGGLVSPRPLPFFFLPMHIQNETNSTSHYTSHHTPRMHLELSYSARRQAWLGERSPNWKRNSQPGVQTSPRCATLPRTSKAQSSSEGGWMCFTWSLTRSRKAPTCLAVCCVCAGQCVWVSSNDTSWASTPPPDHHHHTHTCTHS